MDTHDRWLPVLASLALTSSSRTLSSKSVLAIAGIISLGWVKSQSGARQSGWAGDTAGWEGQGWGDTQQDNSELDIGVTATGLRGDKFLLTSV